MSAPETCHYCGRGPARPTVIHEPTERGTYAPVDRTVCAGCASEYHAAPWGFAVEDDAALSTGEEHQGYGDSSRVPF